MNEKLELMKWLYENGVEPRMCAYIGEKYPLLYDMRDPPAKMVDGKFVEPFDKEVVPYHPLEQVLGELPLMVHEEKYPRYFEQHKNSNGTTSFYYQYGGVKYLEEISDDYHLAALRLLKRVRGGERE